jgi:hypothetical protein
MKAVNGARPRRSNRPIWNGLLRELRFEGKLAKRFRQPAPLQARILQEFEEFGWPEVIEDPLPPDTDHEPKERLHDTIKNLNSWPEISALHGGRQRTGHSLGNPPSQATLERPQSDPRATLAETDGLDYRHLHLFPHHGLDLLLKEVTMRHLGASLLILASLVVAPSNLLADSAIQFDACSPTGGGSSISAAGTYSIDPCECATLKGVVLYAVQPCGGAGGEVACTIDCGCSGWSGTISCLSGSYSVYARLHITVDGVSVYYDTEIVTVNAD